MTKEEKSVKTENRSEKEKVGRLRVLKKEKMKPPTKIIIRHLPPTMTEEEFLKQTDPLPAVDFFYFVPADWSLGYDATCRAYITLRYYDDVFLFRDRFDGYVFVDSKGAEYPAIVEFAPFQGLAKNKSRGSDSRVNTIDDEEHYQQFLAKLEEDREAAAKGGECKLEFSLDRKKEEKITSTPLLQYLALKKEKRREEAKKRSEEKRRQREEDKRRLALVVQQHSIKGNNEQEGVKRNAGNKTGNMDKGGDTVHEERKNSRSKRRAERDQRRREEFEKRKKERERLEPEQKENKNNNGAKVESTNKVAANQGKPAQSGEDAKPQRKDGKRYSEKRERDERNRNRNKEKGSAPKGGNDSFIGSALSTSTYIELLAACLNQSETEPGPKASESSGEGRQLAQDELKETKEQLGKVSLTDEEKIRMDISEQKFSESDDKQQHQTAKQRSSEERRIRNKDRPSIAIYQPKQRLRFSEENETNGTGGGKDGQVRSNSTSDCEMAGKKEEPRSKKVTRYSERRSERRMNKDKLDGGSSNIKSDENNDWQGSSTERRHRIRKSKSYDDSDSNNKDDTANTDGNSVASETIEREQQDSDN